MSSAGMEGPGAECHRQAGYDERDEHVCFWCFEKITPQKYLIIPKIQHISNELTICKITSALTVEKNTEVSSYKINRYFTLSPLHLSDSYS